MKLDFQNVRWNHSIGEETLRISSCWIVATRNCWKRYIEADQWEFDPSNKQRLDDVRLQLRLLWRRLRRTCVSEYGKDSSIVMYIHMSGHYNNFPSVGIWCSRLSSLHTDVISFDKVKFFQSCNTFRDCVKLFTSLVYSSKSENEFYKSMMSYILWRKCCNSSSFRRRRLMRLNLFE